MSARDAFSDEWLLRLRSPWLSDNVTYPRPALCALVKAVVWLMDREVRDVNAWHVLHKVAPRVHEWCVDVWREAVYFPHLDTFFRDMPPFEPTRRERAK